MKIDPETEISKIIDETEFVQSFLIFTGICPQSIV